MEKLKKIIKITPKTKIDEGINYIINSFNNLKYQNIYNFFNFKINSKYDSEEIELLYILIEFICFQSKILLDNPYLLNNYFRETELYKNYNLNSCIFIFMKLQLVFYKELRNKKKKFERVKKYIHEFEKLFLLDIPEHFYTKKIELIEKKKILLNEFNNIQKKIKKYLFILFWIIEKDINENILDKNIIDLEEYKLIQQITDIFLENEPNFNKIDLIQKQYKVLNNYDKFKELVFD
jgi:hypothetical protein